MDGWDDRDLTHTDVRGFLAFGNCVRCSVVVEYLSPLAFMFAVETWCENLKNLR